MKRALLVALVALLHVNAAPAQSVDLDRIPEALRSWIPWVEDPERECPMLIDRQARHCVYAGPLALDVGAGGARFTQRVEVFGHGAWVTLPGDTALRPQDVRANGQPLAVVAGQAPTAWLARGRHEIDGWLRFAVRPATLPVPESTAIVTLVMDGAPVPIAARDDDGRVWLEARAAALAPEDALDVSVSRRVEDGVPLELETRLILRVAGRPREVVLGPVLPAGFAPLALSGSAPARLEGDGRLRVQLRPGAWTLTLNARHEGPVASLSPPAADAPWANEEVWVYDAQPAIRIASVEGVAAIDPNQTELPGEWRNLPAYVVRPGDSMQLAERRRGDPDPHDELELSRAWWLDFDGGGLTFQDSLGGRLRKTSRLEMPAPSSLGRVAINGRDWFLTRLAADGATGVEAPPGSLHIAAEGRVEDADLGAVPAVGWSQDMDSLSGALHLPPGFRLIHAFGADAAFPSWVSSWTLLDFFLVLVTAAGAMQLFGLPAGLLALTALVLTWIEPGAPRLVWIGALAAEALVRVLRGRRIVGETARVLRIAAWVALALNVIPYAVDELRRGLHLAYVSPDATVAGTLGRMAEGPTDAMGTAALQSDDESVGDAVGAEEEIAVPAPREVAPEPVIVAMEHKRSRLADLRALDPNARIPTGPGVPEWSWTRVDLAWSGPVRADQTLDLWLVSPFFSRLVSFARVLLLGLLVAALVRGARFLRDAPPAAPATAALVATLFAMLVGAPPAARAEFPSPELLSDLKQRLDVTPACEPSCASIARLGVELRDDRLRLRIEAHASVASAIPLPSGAPDTEGFGVEAVIVDARPSDALHRDDGLWIALPAGVHDVLVEARVAAGAESVEIALPMRPGSVSIDAPGWSAAGVDADGRAAGALSLRRDAAAGDEAPLASLRPAPPPFFARVERTIHLGVAWTVETRVLRLSAPGQAAVVEVPLLAGEALATEGVPVENGRARVAFAADAHAVAYESTLAPRESIELRAPESVSFVESWQLAIAPIWHVDAEGIPPIAVGNDDSPQRSWRPWPGESLTLRVRRPEGVGGATLTIDSASIVVTPGRRSRDASLVLAVRSTQGGRHTVTLPEGAELRAVQIDGRVQPIRAEGREVSLPIRPGSQRFALDWRSDEEMRWRIATPEVALGAPAVNLAATIAMPSDRWILALAGPRLGPSVLFWSVVLVLIGVAYALSRVEGVPLRFHHWLLLGLGLTQVPVWMGAIVAGWFFALAWRRKHGANLRPLAFDALQITLAIATVVALVVLFAAIQQGLLGAPEMQIAGNGSDASNLRWVQDRSAGELPDASVVSVPLFVYRMAMLAWALWLALAFLRWLRWGFESYSTGGLWKRSLRPERPA